MRPFLLLPSLLSLFAGPALSALLGCSSLQGTNSPQAHKAEGTFLMPDNSFEKSQAEGAAYSADGMLYRKPIPHRRTRVPDVNFYFKHCSLSGQPSHYSKTSYTCFEPN